MLAIVIPTFNERANIEPLIKKIMSVVPAARIVVVDDNSIDGTASAVQMLQKKTHQVDLIVRAQEKGRGGACLAGFEHILIHYPHATFIMEMDADFSHAPTDIPRLVAAADEHTISIGSRYIAGSDIIDWPRWRLFLSILANWYIRLFLGIRIRDYTMGFRCYSRKSIQAINFKKIYFKGFITLSEVAYVLKQKGFRFKEVPVVLKDRTRGKSHASIGEVLKSFAAVLHIRLLHP